MTYPLPGDFGLVRTPRGTWYGSVGDVLIRWGTDSEVNHAVGYVGNGLLIEAKMGQRVRTMPVTEYPDIIWSTGRLGRLTPDRSQRELIVRAWMSYRDEKYNALGLVAVALYQRRMLHLVDGDEEWVKWLSRDGRKFCSQLIDCGYSAAGDHLFTDGRPSGLVSPGDLENLLLPMPAPGLPPAFA